MPSGVGVGDRGWWNPLDPRGLSKSAGRGAAGSKPPSGASASGTYLRALAAQPGGRRAAYRPGWTRSTAVGRGDQGRGAGPEGWRCTPVLRNPRRGQRAPPIDHVRHRGSRTI